MTRTSFTFEVSSLGLSLAKDLRYAFDQTIDAKNLNRFRKLAAGAYQIDCDDFHGVPEHTQAVLGALLVITKLALNAYISIHDAYLHCRRSQEDLHKEHYAHTTITDHASVFFWLYGVLNTKSWKMAKASVFLAAAFAGVAFHGVALPLGIISSSINLIEMILKMPLDGMRIRNLEYSMATNRNQLYQTHEPAERQQLSQALLDDSIALRKLHYTRLDSKIKILMSIVSITGLILLTTPGCAVAGAIILLCVCAAKLVYRIKVRDSMKRHYYGDKMHDDIKTKARNKFEAERQKPGFFSKMANKIKASNPAQELPAPVRAVR